MSPIDPSDITPPSKKELKAIEIDQVPAAVLQAWYHHITKKVEELFEVFKGRYIISFENLGDLFQKLEQTAAQFSCEAVNSEIHANFSDKTRQSFSSFEKFLSLEKTRTAYVVDCEVIFNLHIKVPQSPEFQPYRVTVLCRRHLNSEDDSGFSRRYPSYFAWPSIVFRMTYVDYVVARTFKQLVSEWVEGLEKLKSNKLLEFLAKHEGIIDSAVPGLSFLAACYGAYSLVPAMIDDTNASLARWLVSTFAMIFFATWIGSDATSRMTTQAGRYVTNSQFKITTGDEKELKAAQEQRKTAITMSFALMGIIVVNIVANLLAAFILSVAKEYGAPT